MNDRFASGTGRAGSHLAQVALISAAAVVIGLAARPAPAAQAQGDPCAITLGSPAFAYLHAAATGSIPASPSPYAADCTAVAHPTDPDLALASVRIAEAGSLAQFIVASVDTASEAVGTVVFGEGRDKPRPQAIEYRVLHANHALIVASDPTSTAVTVTGVASGTYDPVIGALVGFAAPTAGDPHGTCAWVVSQAFGDVCTAFDSECAQKSAAVAAAACAVIAP